MPRRVPMCEQLHNVQQRPYQAYASLVYMCAAKALRGTEQAGFDQALLILRPEHIYQSMHLQPQLKSSAIMPRRVPMDYRLQNLQHWPLPG